MGSKETSEGRKYATRKQLTFGDLRRVFDDVADPIAFDDPQGNLIEVNGAFRRLFGLSPDAQPGNIGDYVARSSRDAVLALHRDSVAGASGTARFEFEAVRSDGVPLWVEASAVPLRHHGKCVGTFMIIRDVTAERDSQRRLAEADTVYQNLFDSAFDALIVFEPEGERVLDVNRRACELYGIDRERFIGRSLIDFSTEPARGRVAVEQTTQAERLANWSTTHRRPDGKLLRLQINASQIQYRGHPAILTVNRDVTDLQKLQDRLHHAQRMEAVGRVATGVAHEFNNALATILATSETVLSRVDQPDVRRDLQLMMERTKASAGIARELLDLGRPSQRSRSPLDVSERLNKLRGPLGRLIPPGIHLELNIPDEPMPVLAAPGPLDQVLVNLVINARDALGDDGTIDITVARTDTTEPLHTTTHELEPGRYVCIRVKDSGPGIPEHALPHIFEPFFTTKPRGQGTGMGLAATYGIIRDLDGAIDVANDDGAQFTIYLPARKSRQPVRRVESPAPGHISVCRQTIVLVDDEPLLVDALARRLCDVGFEVLKAGNEAEAEAHFQTRGADIAALVTDVAMPQGDGFELARSVCRERPDLVVVFISGSTRDALPDDLQGATLLPKPFSSCQLQKTLADLLHEG